MAQPPRQHTKGFARTDALLRGHIREASASRGFAESRLLTRWEEIAGPRIAAMSRPVEVSYGRGGMGATLVLLTTGPNAPVLEMEKDRLREKVNAVYGYNAIARIRVTQTAPVGFAEGQVAFAPAPAGKAKPALAPEIRARANASVEDVTDPGLRDALATLGANIISRSKV